MSQIEHLFKKLLNETQEGTQIKSFIRHLMKERLYDNWLTYVKENDELNFGQLLEDTLKSDEFIDNILYPLSDKWEEIGYIKELEKLAKDENFYWRKEALGIGDEIDKFI